MNKNKIIGKAVDTLTDKPLIVEIAPKDVSWLDRLKIKLKLRPATYRYEVKPITVGNFKRIAGRVRQLPENMMQKSVAKALMEDGAEHLDKYLYIVAVGLRNKKKEPSAAFLQLLEQELTWAEIMHIYDYIMAGIDIEAFIKSTILIKGADILKMGPTANEEIIASTILGEQ